MSTKEIITYPDPVLRKKSEPVEKVDKEIKQLIEDMTETMYASRGIGLAAIQIGVLKRVILVNVGEGLVLLVNPEILEDEGETQMEEGCLCLPGVMLEVKRSEKVKVKGLNRKGEEIIIHAEGLLARALQHEIDHLKGVLIIDKISKIKRELVTSKLKKEAKERVAAEKSKV
ncbi:MAG: peptide deformylase [Deltaproteobacteria bacterium]|jgi:peptide deformylase|nr:peptide deformylase [Deltaproteobacteria bacterium]MBW2554263.1 peptide deformylase [Deltaproteobacteria bacterium]